jgi:hypothetical protein
VGGALQRRRENFVLTPVLNCICTSDLLFFLFLSFSFSFLQISIIHPSLTMKSMVPSRVTGRSLSTSIARPKSATWEEKEGKKVYQLNKYCILL